MRCLVRNETNREMCAQIESVINQCNRIINDMKGAPPQSSYCIDEMVEYARCSIKPNTSMCANQEKILHECKLKRRRFLFGEDLGLVNMNPQARKRW